MKSNIKNHFGYLSLILSIIPTLVTFKYWSVNFSVTSLDSMLVLVLLPLSFVFGLLSIPRWQSFIAIIPFAYFAYRLLTDPVCLVYG
jgi:hypothetical protein